MADPPKVVINPNANRARRCLTLLMLRMHGSPTYNGGLPAGSRVEPLDGESLDETNRSWEPFTFDGLRKERNFLSVFVLCELHNTEVFVIPLTKLPKVLWTNRSVEWFLKTTRATLIFWANSMTANLKWTHSWKWIGSINGLDSIGLGG